MFRGTLAKMIRSRVVANLVDEPVLHAPLDHVDMGRDVRAVHIPSQLSETREIEVTKIMLNGPLSEYMYCILTMKT